MAIESSPPPIGHANQPHNAIDSNFQVLTLQLREVEILQGSQKGKHRASTPSDFALALQAYEDELLTHVQFLRDLSIAHSFANAVEQDGDAISGLIQLHQQETADHQFALQLSGNNEQLEAPPPYSKEQILQRFELDFQGTDNRTFVGLDDSHAEEDMGPSSSEPYLNKQAQALSKLASTKLKCSACFNHVFASDAVALPCGDQFCTDCLKSLFVRSTKDEGLYPPRCCRELIPLSTIEKKMTADELNTFEAAGVEFSTTDRTYCSNAECAAFVPPANITAGKIECHRCGTATCTMCKMAYHTDDCIADHELQATLALAESEGWKRCPRCRAMVELKLGCYHITCKCGDNWCYLCTLPWKSCDCPQWHDTRLVARAEELVDREAPHALPVQERRRRVEHMQEELRDRHDCDHGGRFERIESRSRKTCEMCGDRHWKFILQCRHCHLRVCQDCRCHRI